MAGAVLAAGILAAGLTAAAQEIGTTPRAAADAANPPLVSPVVSGGKATFRIAAPNAKSVVLSGDFGPDLPLSRGPDGIWTVTSAPLKPDQYVYYFTVDGVKLPDPANPEVKIGYLPSTTNSILDVPGPERAFFDVQDVPHGEVRTLLYRSKSNQVTRELNVYLPPGYDADTKTRYPVVYLLHGYANDHHSWLRYGRANDIMDNLLARKAALPFIVVMPLGYGGVPVNGTGNGVAPEKPGPYGGDFALYERDIMEDVIPLIDTKFRTKADRDDRAIVGFSMGGAQAGRFGLDHLETFSSIGMMSAGLVGNPATGPDPIAPLAAQSASVNKRLKLLWIACGLQDTTALKGAQATHAAFDKAGIRHTWVESEGAHQWRVWRRYWRDLAPLLFRP